MIDAIALLLAGLLGTISLLHLYWALGGVWPGHDTPSLARAVVGSRGIVKMPPVGVTTLVAIALAAAALWPLMWAALVPYSLPQTVIVLGMWLWALLFVTRGLAGYLPIFGTDQMEQPFARLNRRIYSPLCLAIGAGFVALIVLARL